MTLRQRTEAVFEAWSEYVVQHCWLVLALVSVFTGLIVPQLRHATVDLSIESFLLKIASARLSTNSSYFSASATGSQFSVMRRVAKPPSGSYLEAVDASEESLSPSSVAFEPGLSKVAAITTPSAMSPTMIHRRELPVFAISPS